MITVISHCDRCNKMLEDKVGYQFQIIPRNGWGYRTKDAAPEDVLSVGEICDGCYNILHFFFRERFRDAKPSAPRDANPSAQ